VSLVDFSSELNSEISELLRVSPLALQSAYSSLFFDPQVLTNSCAINAQLQLMEEYLGVNLPEDVLAAYARSNGIFDASSGTPVENMDGLLRDAGFQTQHFRSESLDFLKAHLDYGNEILAPIDVDGNGAVDHAIRILGYDDGIIHVVDPSLGFTDYTEESFNTIWQGDGVVVPLPDLSDQSVISERVESIINSVSPDQYSQLAQDELSTQVRDMFINPAEVSYQEFVAGIPATEGDVAIDDLPKDVRDDIANIDIDVGNILATGGYMALMQFYNDHPEKQKKITKVAMAIGAFDALTNFGDQSIQLDFEINPLLITSLAYYISLVGSKSKNTRIQKMSIGFNKLASKSFRVMEYAGYSAIAIEALDLLTNVDLVPILADVIDAVDFLDVFGNVADVASGGADLIDGFATLGIGIVASRIVRSLFKKLNKKDVDEITRLTKTTTPKKVLAKLLELDAPVELLCGPYIELNQGSKQC
jgi:hypothetical protein